MEKIKFYERCVLCGANQIELPYEGDCPHCRETANEQSAIGNLNDERDRDHEYEVMGGLNNE